MSFKKKFLIILLLVVYNLSYLLNFFQYIPFTRAEDQRQSWNIVAVLVDKDIMPSIEDNLRWYTTEYIQQTVVNSKALVIPVNKTTFQAKDIAKILENLYLAGESDHTSKLIWTVLVWDLPLPVVKRESFIFPSIFPYVDFKDKRFVYDYSTNYFEYVGNDSSTPEIWHWVVKFAWPSDYNKFFEKLKKYKENPTQFADNKIWYEDFLYLKKLFVENNLSYYINNLVYAEDISYKRYVNLMYNLMAFDYNNYLKTSISNFSNNLNLSQAESQLQLSWSDSEFWQMRNVVDTYFKKMWDFKNNFMKPELLSWVANSSEKIPTLLVQQSLESFFKKYNDVFWNLYLSRLKDNITASWRWTTDQADSHVEKVFVRDEFTKSILVEYNNVLEKAIDKKVLDDKYYMSVPVMTDFEDWASVCSATSPTPVGWEGWVWASPTARVSWVLNGQYENFYFWKNAKDINYAGDFSIYRWSYRNFVNPTQLSGFQNINQDDINLDPISMSVGWSNWVFSRKIEANRWYNFLKAQTDGNLFASNRCWNAETMEQWVNRRYGWYSPLNIDSSSSLDIKLKPTDYKIAWNPSFNKSVWWPVFDIWWSFLSPNVGGSYLDYKTYSSSSIVKSSISNWVTLDWTITHQVNNSYHCEQPITTLWNSQTDFFHVYNWSTAGAWDLLSITLKWSNWNKTQESWSTVCICGWAGWSTPGPSPTANSTNKPLIAESESVYGSSPDTGVWAVGGEVACTEDYKTKQYYNYKFVNSTVYHKSPTAQEISGLNYVTYERPVDDPRYVSFLGLWWDEVRLLYPDLFKVPAYYQSWDRYYLKSQTEIENAVRDYLRQKVQKYNSLLQSQLDKKWTFYNTNKNWYDFLASAESTATPNRWYTLLDENFLVNLMGDDNIKRAAASIYYQNIGWSEKKPETNYMKNIETLKATFNLNKKILYVENKYIKTDTEADPLTNINYNRKWYEAWFINSDGIDAIDTTKMPDIISKIQSLKSWLGSMNWSFSLDELRNMLLANKESRECWVWADWAVMIFQWPSALMCRLSKTMQKPMWLTIDYGCSLWSLFWENDDDVFQDMFAWFDWLSVLNTPSAILATDFLRKKYNDFTQKYPADKWSTYIKNWKPRLSIDRSANDKILEALSELQKEEFRKIQNNITINLLPSANIVVDDQVWTQNHFVKIGSLKDIWNVSIDIAAIGDSCVLVNNTNVCRNNLSLSVNPFSSETLLPITLQDHKAWNTILQFKICKGEICEYRNKNLSLLPSTISKLEVITPADRALKWWKHPFMVKAYDRYDNEIGQIPEEFKVSIDMWKIDYNWSLVDNVSINNFKNWFFLLDSSNLSWVAWNINVKIKVEPTQIFRDLNPSLPTIEKNITLVPWVAAIKHDWADVNNIEYTLPDDFSHLYSQDQNWLNQLNESSILKYRLELRGEDGQPLNSPVTLSTNGMMLPWIVGNSKKYLYSGNVAIIQKEFFQKNEYIITWWNIEFYLHPTLKAGTDTLSVSIPWLSDIRIPVRVYPASPIATRINFDKERLNINETMTGRVFAEDTWWNIVDNRHISISVGTIWNIKLNWASSIQAATDNWIVTFQVSTVDPGGKWYVYSSMDHLSMESQVPDYKNIIVTNKLWPSDKLNIMYLSLFWSDWWNMWKYFSDKNNVSTNILANSNKTLAITTQLIDLTQVKKISYMVREDLKILKFDQNDVFLWFSWSDLIFKFGANNPLATVNVWNPSSFSMQRVDSLTWVTAWNTISYIPESLDTDITSNLFENWQIKINNSAVVDFTTGYISSDVKILLNNNIDYNFNIFDVNYRSKKVWSLVVSKNNLDIINNYPNNVYTAKSYGSIVGFGQGSTNWKKAIMIFNSTTDMTSLSKWYNSVEDSSDFDQDIGFRWSFKNLTHFANWNNVWDSTKASSSEYMINFWDPILTRVDKNQIVKDTNYDLGIWKNIYSNNNGSIIKVLSIDFNNDWLKDMLIANNDWSIKILKNYWWNDNFSNLWDIVVIADGIKDIWAWDVDGNWYEDIIIRSKKDFLRVYLNQNWVLDLNGKLACLDVDGGPEKMTNVTQIFVKDMDLDNKVDIVTSDTVQNIKIFYWWSDSRWYYYLSNEQYWCDNWWRDRQQWQMKLVRSYALEIGSWHKVVDNSYVHRSWLINPSRSDRNIVSNWNLAALTWQLAQITWLSINQAMSYQEFPVAFRPVYENSNADDYDYYKISYLDWTSPIEVYKKYEDINGWILLKWDPVKIEIHIRSNQNRKVTYIENLQWPWIVQKNENWVISGFNQWNINNDALVKRDIEWYQYMIDNISVSPAAETVYSYIVYYAWKDPMKIDVDKVNEDAYPDIKVYTNDSCIKWYFAFLWNSWNIRNYEEKFMNLVDKYVQNVKDLQDKNLKTFSELGEKINSLSWDIQNLNGVLWMTESTPNYWWFMDLGGRGDDGPEMDMNINVDILWEQTAWLKSQISGIMRKLCSWFKFWKDDGCTTLPIPFNNAFLVPWIPQWQSSCISAFASMLWVDLNGMASQAMSAMGLGFMNGPSYWLPVFFFPGTMYMPWPVPVPNWLKWKADGFIRAPWWKYPSRVRLYVGPTLTMSLWFAACFGLYEVGMKMPTAPMGSIAWNCVVASMPLNFLSCKKPAKNTFGSYQLESRQLEMWKIGSCNKTNPRKTSPFQIVVGDWGLANYSPLSFEWNYFGWVMNLEEEPRSMVWGTVWGWIASIDTSYTNIKAWKTVNLKIEWWDVKWLFACIINKWLDNQIRYIINNLTSMTLYVYYPDFDDVTKWFDKLKGWWGKITSAFNWYGDNIMNSIDSAINSSSSSSSNESYYQQAKAMLPSKQALKNIGKSVSNPFEAMSNFFDEIPLIKMQTKALTIQVPFVYLEDIERYEIYLKWWLAENEAILREWENIWRDVAWSCGSKPTQAERTECNNTANKYVDVSVKAWQLVRSIRQNIKTLQEYKEYPLKLYEYVHAIDRYMSEIICIIESFVKSTIGWLKSNAKRFEKWVDFIILLIGIIKTWQILIDFSVNWKMACWKCRQDTYDASTCILSLLCIDLPVLPIPPFKIPDIYLDFSKIWLWINVLLPTFKFKPTKIPFLKLPNLPRPWWIWLNISLPSLPLLPKLPELPQLPSFLPRFKLDLPYLPPAPRIPAIMPAIKAVIQIAEFIWMILCIIKNWIWLVAEWNVKYRIEQLTQRNYWVSPFDNFRITIPKPPLAWFDVRLDSYLNLRFNFDMFYQFAESLKNSINSSTNAIIKDVGETMLKASDSVEWLWAPLDNAQLNIDVNTRSWGWINWNWSSINIDDWSNNRLRAPRADDRGNTNLFHLFNYTTWDSNSGYEYKDAYKMLKTWLLYLQEKDDNISRKNKAKDVVALIDTPKNISPNIQWVEKLQDEAIKTVKQQQSKIGKMADMIKNDYNKFLNSIAETDLVVETDTIDAKFSTNLFNWKKEIIDTLKTQENPYKTYIDLNDEWLKRFKHSLDTNTPKTLNMTQEVYNKSKNYVTKLSALTSEVKSYFGEETPKTTYKALDNIVQWWNVQTSPTPSAPESTIELPQPQAAATSPNVLWDPQQLVDLTQYIRWMFTKWTDTYYHNIIEWEDFWDKVRKWNKFNYVDINNDAKDDMILWDNNGVYIKYADQNDMHLSTQNQMHHNYYRTQDFDNIDQLLATVDQNWYYNIDGQIFKIWDRVDAVSNFIRDGQNANTVSFSWLNNSGQNTWYVLEFVQRVDVYNDKVSPTIFNNLAEKKYLLVVDQSFDQNIARVNVDWLNWIANDLLRSWKIIDIIKKDLSQPSTTISIDKSKLADRWYYARINNLVNENNRYMERWPWSYQQVVWIQIWWDNQAPTIWVSLIRRNTWQQIARGNNLNWFINTYYNLVADATDNGQVRNMWIEYSWAMIQVWTWKTITLENQFFTGPVTKEFVFGAVDSMWNSNRQTVNLNITVPTLDVANVNLSGSLATIQAQLSNDIDEWSIWFERDRWQFWETLTWTNNSWNVSRFDVWPSQNNIEWRFFRVQDDIVLYNNSFNPIWRVNINTWRITLDSWYEANYNLNVNFSQRTPLIYIYDRALGRNIFNIYMRIQSLPSNAITTYWDYESVSLSWTSYGDFNGWYCIKRRTGDCQIYVSNNWIYVPEPYNNIINWTYRYNDWVVYEVSSDTWRVADIKFIPNPLR